MEDLFAGTILMVIPGAIFFSFVSTLVFILARKTKFAKTIRTIGLILTMISFLATFGLTFLLLAHPYMVYSLVAAGISFLAFILIYFMKPATDKSVFL